MKNIVILSGELFVHMCVCFDVVIHGYVSGIKKNILKRLLSLFISFNYIMALFTLCSMKKG